MNDLSGGAIYRATIQPTSVLKKRMATFLGSMNPAWAHGGDVALLIESNTAYGNSGTAAPHSKPVLPDGPLFPDAAVFWFPLHVAQLRSDASTSSQPAASLLPTAIIPLNMREASPPADLIPALRPQLTSAVVEATVDSILDAIRHEKRTAVGIIATDDRDSLFLAREVKRTSPDVQLFLFGAHSLYLHSDYVPYLRGTLVASSYSLSLANQPEVDDFPLKSPNHNAADESSTGSFREPFQSMSAEGIFHATRTLVAASRDATARKSFVPASLHCAFATKWCVPCSSIGRVISEDGCGLPTHPAQFHTGLRSQPTHADAEAPPRRIA